MMTPEQLASVEALLGKPYRAGADGPDAYDCYGLAKAVRTTLGDDEMPDLPRESMQAEDAAQLIVHHSARREWRQVETPAHGDLVVMANVLARDHHLGVCLVPETTILVIHTHPDRGVIVNDLVGLPAWGFNHLRFYRHAA